MNDTAAEQLVAFVMRWEGFKVHEAKKAAKYFQGRVLTYSYDMWGSADLAGVHEHQKNWVVQVTGGKASSQSARRKKLRLTGFSLEHNRVFLAVPVNKWGHHFIKWQRLRRDASTSNGFSFAEHFQPIDRQYREFKKPIAERKLPKGFGGPRYKVKGGK